MKNIKFILTIGFILTLFSIFFAIIINSFYTSYTYKFDKIFFKSNKIKFETFKSENDFIEYIKSTKEVLDRYKYSDKRVISERIKFKEVSEEKISEQIQRYSETNIQVKGIDEPDIVKTDGKNIYYSPKKRGIKILKEKSKIQSNQIFPDFKTPGTKIINAFPLKNLKLASKIKANGELLLFDNVLVILPKFYSNTKIIKGVDISVPENPKEIWSFPDFEGYYESSRAYNGKLYLILKKYISPEKPCPILYKDIKIMCSEIYHPSFPVLSNQIYTIFIIDPKTGKIIDKISFITGNKTIVYMSKNALYITYQKSVEYYKIFLDFIKNDLISKLPKRLKNRINEILNYNLRELTKYSEIQYELKKYKEIDYQNLFNEYYNKNIKNIIKSVIVKIEITQEKFKSKYIGTIPGVLLNQFSMDENKGFLRIGVSLSSMRFRINQQNMSENGILILDKNLKIVGQIWDLGISERIYAVRFIDNIGYLVTFREIDPFYIIDISDPKTPKLIGELKIPGYSSYLHPLKNNLILGIGKENWKLKLSLFDVSDLRNPKEIDKIILDEYFSETLVNHKAFLEDSKNQLFFIPTTNTWYIFSYKDKKLNLLKEIKDKNPERAVFINNYLYLLSYDKIAVYDELTLKKIKEIKI